MVEIRYVIAHTKLSATPPCPSSINARAPSILEDASDEMRGMCTAVTPPRQPQAKNGVCLGYIWDMYVGEYSDGSDCWFQLVSVGASTVDKEVVELAS
jgi:hypothetical protein